MRKKKPKLAKFLYTLGQPMEDDTADDVYFSIKSILQIADVRDGGPIAVYKFVGMKKLKISTKLV